MFCIMAFKFLGAKFTLGQLYNDLLIWGWPVAFLKILLFQYPASVKAVSCLFLFPSQPQFPIASGELYSSGSLEGPETHAHLSI